MALLFALIVSARADTLTLRNGTRVTGSWLGGDAGQVRFLVYDQIRTYPRSDVSKVTFGPELTAPPPISPSPPPIKPPDAGSQDTSIKDRGAAPPLKVGQTIDDVEAALGKPSQLFNNLPGGKKVYTYKDPPVKITFKDGKVVDIE
jgi:hypothetical protein